MLLEVDDTLHCPVAMHRHAGHLANAWVRRRTRDLPGHVVPVRGRLRVARVRLRGRVPSCRAMLGEVLAGNRTSAGRSRGAPIESQATKRLRTLVLLRTAPGNHASEDPGGRMIRSPARAKPAVTAASDALDHGDVMKGLGATAGLECKVRRHRDCRVGPSRGSVGKCALLRAALRCPPARGASLPRRMEPAR